MQKEDRDRLLGTRLGPYRVVKRLGMGGMGEVYFGEDTSLERPVALKVLRPDHVNKPTILERFRREAKAAARLNHPYIVQIYAVGEDQGVAYIAMEYVEGESLDRLLVREGKLGWQRALTICGQVASALECAHERGIIHRDVKPANILVDTQGRARVTDFGVAKILESAVHLTTDNMFLGTPQYMSPEQCGVGTIAPSSDLFSLGVVLYEMLSGRLPFEAETPAALVRKITVEAPAAISSYVPDLPQSVEVLIERLLAKDLSSRYSNAQELLLDLQQIRAGALIARSPIENLLKEEIVLERPRTAPLPAVRSIPWLPIIVIAGVIIAFAVGAKMLIGSKRGGENQTATPEEPAPARSTPPNNSRPSGLGLTSPEPPTGGTLPPPEDLLARYDTRPQDGRLTANEVPTEFWAKFILADRDRDGALTLDELRFAREQFERRGPPPNEGQMPMQPPRNRMQRRN